MVYRDFRWVASKYMGFLGGKAIFNLPRISAVPARRASLGSDSHIGGMAEVPLPFIDLVGNAT
jgi:hypothetical protein